MVESKNKGNLSCKIVPNFVLDFCDLITFNLDARAESKKPISLDFGWIEDTTMCFWNLLTFSGAGVGGEFFPFPIIYQTPNQMHRKSIWASIKILWSIVQPKLIIHI